MIRSVKQMNVGDWDGLDESKNHTGFGALQTKVGCLPLVAMDVSALATGLLLDIVVRQEFHNSTDDSLEATYIFPLPPRAAVTQVNMHVNGRVIKSQLKERSEARQTYREALRRGQQVAMLEEDRADVFTLQVGNLPPGESVEVELRLSMLLDVSAGMAEFRFPLVVAPRYVSGMPLRLTPVGRGVAEDTLNVPDASRISPPVLLPGFPSPVRLEFEVKLAEGTLPPHADAPSKMSCSLQNTVTLEGNDHRIQVCPGEALNRDFILRFPVADEHVRTSLRTSAAGPDRPDVFSLTLIPPNITSTELPIARDIVFLLDRSGSMHGWKIVTARRALAQMIDSLHDRDRFSVIAFNGVTHALPHEPLLLTATPMHRWNALNWINNVSATGSTEMHRALQDAVQRVSAETASQREKIIVLVTDGQIAGEDEVLRLLGSSAQEHELRVFTIGIDQVVNEGFLRRVADRFQGQCHLVESEQQLEASMSLIRQSIELPVLTRLQIEPINCEFELSSIVPSRLPDLYPGRPVSIFGRCTKYDNEFGFRVHATDRSGKAWTSEAFSQTASPEPLLSQWGRAMICELEDKGAAYGGDDRLRKEIVDISLESGAISRFTAFVATDTSRVVNPGGDNTCVTQPVEFPAGWEVKSYADSSDAGEPLACAAFPSVSQDDLSLRMPRRLKMGLLDWQLQELNRANEPKHLWQRILRDAIELESEEIRVKTSTDGARVVYVSKSKRVTRKPLSESDCREFLEWAESICGISDHGGLSTEYSTHTTQDIGDYRVDFNVIVYPPASRHLLKLMDLNWKRI